MKRADVICVEIYEIICGGDSSEDDSGEDDRGDAGDSCESCTLVFVEALAVRLRATSVIDVATETTDE